MIEHISRRNVLKGSAAAALAGLAPARLFAQATGRIVIVGGGFGGATCARFLRRLAPELQVTLVEQSDAIVTCPFSNTVIAGMNDIAYVTHGLDALRADGVEVVQARAAAIDADARTLRLEGGDSLPWDRLVLSPGIDIKWDAIEGYDQAAAEIMPHAWKAGPQTTLLRRQLEAMEDGGVVVMGIPANPFRCPPGPYERASLIAHYLKTSKPRSKLLLVDSKDSFSKQGLFMEGWEQLYPDLIEWIPFGQIGAMMRVDPETKTIFTDFDEFSGDVVNFIPPQRSSRLVDTAGLADGRDWCEVNPVNFESVIVPGVHILGDAIIAGSMPKSGFSASSQARVCAYAIAAMQGGEEPATPSFINTCYSLVAPDYGISVVDVFRVGDDGMIAAVEGAGGVSPTGATQAFREAEADYARGWYASLMTEMYG